MSVGTPVSTATTDTIAKPYFATALAFLVIASGLGAFLRYIAVNPIQGIDYRFLLHAHSHIAFLGWVFNAFIAIAACLFVRNNTSPPFRKLFVSFQIANCGMLLSFPFQGYATASISFSTLHMLCSGIFAVQLWKSSPTEDTSSLYLKAALAFMLLSALGPLSLGPLAAMDLRDSPWYSLSIYFYLHFQYNGWFIFFLIAALLKAAERNRLSFSKTRARNAAYWLIAGALLNVTLSALWIHPPLFIEFLALASGCAQLIGFTQLLTCLLPLRSMANLDPIVRLLSSLVIVAITAKFFLQLFGALPGLSSFSIDRSSAVAFLHLVFLGVVTPSLLAWAIHRNWLNRSPVLGPSLIAYTLSFLLTEAVLFGQALFNRLAIPFPFADVLLVLGSVLLFASSLGFLFCSLSGRLRYTSNSSLDSLA